MHASPAVAGEGKCDPHCGGTPMPIQFYCSHCGNMIEVAEAHAGQQVSCPYCQQGTVSPAASKGPVAPPPAPVYSPYPAPYPASNGKAVASFVLGICGFVVGWPITPILAIVLGKMALSELRYQPHSQNQRQASNGVSMGIISLCVYGGIIVLSFTCMFAFIPR